MSIAEFYKIKRAEVVSPDPVEAVHSLSGQLHKDDIAGVIFFCSSSYDQDALAAEFRARFDCPVAGCTTAGEIGTRYQENGIVAVSFGKSDFCLHPVLIPSMAGFDAKASFEMADKVRGQLEFSQDLDPDAMFAMVLLDGLSVMEEPVTAYIHAALKGVPLIGGSAGDSLKFRETRVFADGRFYTGAGVFIMIESRLPFKTFKLQHFEPSDKDLVITEADPKTRVVSEIDGAPAAEEYASILGLKIQELSPQVFARYPVMLEIGDQWYVRSIQKVNPDGSLTFFCAIDNGLVLTVARGVGFVETLEAAIDKLAAEFSTILCTIGCDCILRRLELTETGKTARAEAALARLNFVGFSTFGEQFNAIHVNQTLTGVVIGEK
ncbi:MAG: hypothetical protein A2277_06320 [Desulfobacterales bacterium RIFOXYA12_FULL_46_15]|nr:MAG: hypothetical protein A2277_06320 [Desulfobacterales bacterium RIFOXYA12_FULL_46_15]